MDAYDEDSGARRGTGAFEPLEPPGPPRPPEQPRPSRAPRQSRASEPSRPSRSGEAPYPPEQSDEAEPSEPSVTNGTNGPTGSVASPELSEGGHVLSSPLAPPVSPRTGVAALSPRYQVGAAVALAVVAIGACVHLLMVFLSLAPANTVTKQHGKAVEEWIYPEFEQNWKLFAPNPLQQDIAVQVRARIRGADGGSRTTGWYDLSAQDGRAIDGNPLPSHTQQNELRRSWDLFVATHDTNNRPIGLRGTLSETYLRRIVVLRIERENATAKGDVLVSVQVRSRTSNVPPPKWSEEKVSVQPVYRELSWWPVTTDDTEGSVR